MNKKQIGNALPKSDKRVRLSVGDSSFLGLAVTNPLLGLCNSFLTCSGEIIVLDLNRDAEGDSVIAERVLEPMVMFGFSVVSLSGDCLTKIVFLLMGEGFGMVLNPDCLFGDVHSERIDSPVKFSLFCNDKYHFACVTIQFLVYYFDLSLYIISIVLLLPGEIKKRFSRNRNPRGQKKIAVAAVSLFHRSIR
jgi:hypothetical protein